VSTEGTRAQDNPETSQLINAAVADVARTAERRAAVEASLPTPGQRRQRAVLAALLVTLPVLAFSFMVNVMGIPVRSLFAQDPPPALARRQAEDTLQQAVQEIESYKRDFDELPTTLAQVGVHAKGDWSYQFSRGQYRLMLRMHNQTVEFDSSQKPGTDAPPR
jgi:hypothetical protein